MAKLDNLFKLGYVKLSLQFEKRAVVFGFDRRLTKQKHLRCQVVISEFRSDLLEVPASCPHLKADSSYCFDFHLVFVHLVCCIHEV